MNRATARFRFFGDIGQFLAPPKRNAPFEFSCARAANLKNAIEALGVPHTEVGPVTVNGEPATLQRMVRDSDLIEVRPREKEIPGLFLADAHLGGLARFLRILGYASSLATASSSSAARLRAAATCAH
jgi:hypothetical protein